MSSPYFQTDKLPIHITEQQAPSLSCNACRNGKNLDFNFSMAFQPLVDLEKAEVYGYESLVRGLNGESAFEVLKKVTTENVYRFDQACRVKSIALAASAKLDKNLSINFMPGAVYKPEHCIRTTLAAARDYGFPLDKISFEIVETDHVADLPHLYNIIESYKSMGFRTALDDFGSKHANLDWLVSLQPDIIKLDITLIRDIDSSKRKQLIVSHVSQLCKDLGITVLAEGVETRAERDRLIEMGIFKQQGYYFGKPMFETFEQVDSVLLD
ncbi:EAL domain-containing protein [Glaciecola sp. 1036]|uniref:EAL domain-containing protein n=1 Tax=Alteromonadaceae TaxID=72275 RepID=UPI003CFD893D